MSSIGKGVVASAIGFLMQASGYRVSFVKTDPYFCVDAGRLAPSEMGETFVLHNGALVDNDLGNYERLLGIRMGTDNCITTGRVFRDVLRDEERGAFGGAAVRLVPHVSSAMRRALVRGAHSPVTEIACARHPLCLAQRAPRQADVVIVEIGGAIGEYETAGWMHAAREIRAAHPERVLSVLVGLVPEAANEQITRLATLGVEQLRAAELPADVIVCRSSRPLGDSARRQIAVAASIQPSAVISDADVAHPSTAVVFQFMQQNLLQVLLRATDKSFPVADLNRLSVVLDRLRATHRATLALEGIEIEHTRRQILLNIPSCPPSPGPGPSAGAGAGSVAGTAAQVQAALQAATEPRQPLRILIVGKYVTGSHDVYRSVELGIRHAALLCAVPVKIRCIDSQLLEAGDHEAQARLERADAILVPGGFGTLGVEGKIQALQYALRTDKPSLGICLGFQSTLIAACRLHGMRDAHSTEFEPETPYPVISNLFSDTGRGETATGRIRIGHHTFRPRAEAVATLPNGRSKIVDVYTALRGDEVGERHRHRFAVNNDLVAKIEAETPVRFVFDAACAGAAGGACAAPTCGAAETPVMEVLEYAGTRFNCGLQSHPEMTSRPGAAGPAFVGLVMAAAGMEFDEKTLALLAERSRQLDPWHHGSLLAPACAQRGLQ